MAHRTDEKNLRADSRTSNRRPVIVATMSATWTCICGKTFIDYGAVSGDEIRCPECGYIVGESLPTHFESSTTFQSEPPERVVLASPEVAVQATEPLARPCPQSAIDELAEPDIRVKSDRSQLVLCVAAGMVAAVLALLTGLISSWAQWGSIIATLHKFAKVLAIVCDASTRQSTLYPTR